MASISLEKRLRVYERDGFRCRDCSFETTRERVLELIDAARGNDGRFPRGELLTIDHIVPRAFGGRSVDSNLQTLCAPCNQRKGCRVPDGVSVRPAPPRRDAPRLRLGVAAPSFATIAARLHRPGCDAMFGCVGGCPVRGAGHPVI